MSDLIKKGKESEKEVSLNEKFTMTKYFPKSVEFQWK